MNPLLSYLRRHVLPYWKSFLIVAVPLLLMPLLISGAQEAQVAYIMILMAIYWMAGTLPMPITGLIPVIAFPLMGIMDTSQICANYFNETNMLILGAFIVSLAVEYCNLHLRIALRVVLWVGTDLKMLMLGVMLVTMFLSMWINNGAATSMILPIVDVLTKQIFGQENNFEPTSQSLSTLTIDEEEKAMSREHDQLKAERRNRTICVTLLVSVSFAANIGGSGTLIGSVPSLVLKGISDELYGPSSSLTFGSYFAIIAPTMIINLLILWAMLQISLLGLSCKRKAEDATNDKQMKELVQKKYDELGPMTFHEVAVLIIFTILVNFWMWRDPKFVTGWGPLFSRRIGDAVPAVIMAIVLFMLPNKLNFWCWRSASIEETPKANKAMIDWQFIQDKMPWGLFLIIGGGVSCAEAARVSGLSQLMGEQLGVLESLPRFAILLIICLFISCLTEIVSNTAMANIVLPVLAQMAETVKVAPMYLMIPAAAMCNYVFVLPVGTAPNALAFGVANWKLSDTLKIGLLFKFVSILVVCGVMETIGRAVLGDLNTHAITDNSTLLSSV